VLLHIELLGDNVVKSEHDVAPGFIIVLNPTLDVVVIEMVLGQIIHLLNDITTIGSFGGNLLLRIDLFRERLYDGVTPLALGKEVVLHGWAPSHVVGSVENRNELSERVGHFWFLDDKEVSVYTRQT